MDEQAERVIRLEENQLHMKQELGEYRKLLRELSDTHKSIDRNLTKLNAHTERLRKTEDDMDDMEKRIRKLENGAANQTGRNRVVYAVLGALGTSALGAAVAVWIKLLELVPLLSGIVSPAS